MASGHRGNAPAGVGGNKRGGNRRALAVVCIVSALVIVVACIVAGVLLLGRRGEQVVPQGDGDVPTTFGEVPTEEEIAEGEAEAEDELDAWIEDYLARSDVRETLDAASASISEAEAYAAFEERGFDASEVTVTYEDDGTYHDAEPISAGSDKRHPAYTLQFISESGEIWTVACYGDCFTAMPIGRNMTDDRVQTTLSEQETIVSYDSEVNVLYRLVPPSDDLTVHQVESVSASYLDSLSVEEVSEL